MSASKCAAVICLPGLHEEQRGPSDDRFLGRSEVAQIFLLEQAKFAESQKQKSGLAISVVRCLPVGS